MKTGKFVSVVLSAVLIAAAACGCQKSETLESWAYSYESETEALKLCNNGTAVFDGNDYTYTKDFTFEGHRFKVRANTLEELYDKIQEIYAQYFKPEIEYKQGNFGYTKAPDYGYSEVEKLEFAGKREYTADDFVSYTGTHCTHIVIPEPYKTRFFDGLRQAVLDAEKPRKLFFRMLYRQSCTLFGLNVLRESSVEVLLSVFFRSKPRLLLKGLDKVALRRERQELRDVQTRVI